MKRQLKFRFWNPDKFMMEDHRGWREDIGINEALEASQDYGYKIMQFTGLKDKNGKDVYDGDLLKHDENSESDKAVVVVVYKTEQAKFYCDEINDSGYGGDLDEWIGCEIVGNIYETPSLLHTGA